jgi:hypothetical protein
MTPFTFQGNLQNFSSFLFCVATPRWIDQLVLLRIWEIKLAAEFSPLSLGFACSVDMVLFSVDIFFELSFSLDFSYIKDEFVQWVKDWVADMSDGENAKETAAASSILRHYDHLRSCVLGHLQRGEAIRRPSRQKPGGRGGASLPRQGRHRPHGWRRSFRAHRPRTRTSRLPDRSRGSVACAPRRIIQLLYAACFRHGAARRTSPSNGAHDCPPRYDAGLSRRLGGRM